MKAPGLRLRWCIFVLLFLAAPSLLLALQPPNDNSDLRQKEFFLPELYLSNLAASYADIADQLANRAAIDAFIARYGSGTIVNFDPRSGFPMSIITPIPLIPGQGNKLTAAELSRQLGRPVGKVDDKVVADLFRNFLEKNRAALGIDTNQLGPVTAVQVNNRLWNISVPQEVNGVPVRWGRYVATINSGNIVVQGAANWGNVKIDTRPTLSYKQAIEIGFNYVGGQRANDRFWKKPELEIIPIAPPQFAAGEGFGGPVGSGYGHRLAWVFGFSRAPEHPQWELLVDAHSGEVLAMEDKNQYIDQKIEGGAYPLTNTEMCPSNDRCGVMQPNTPMPFVNTGLPAPNNFTNSAGIFDYTSGTVTTSLDGPYVAMNDTCGALSESASGGINLGGTTGDHDCVVPTGTSPGNTAAMRSGAYEVNKLFETARGYLPGLPWLHGNQGGPLPTNMNINLECNAFYSLGDPGSINFYKNLGSCRNTGEIAAVFDHEWGHGLDDHDSIGALSSSSEGYADIASMYRLWASCVGYGFFLANQAPGIGCGVTADGTGANQDEAQTGPLVCDLDCSGVRDADYTKITGGLPLGASFVCASCLSGGGPCGRQVHCSATPTREAAWNFVARELQNPPGTDVDANTAFLIGDRVFYLGSGNIGSWHNCSCPTTSDGCNADGGYLNWLAADDDDGNINNGTPHMTDLHTAFNTNGIACNTVAPVDSGCAGGPTTPPVVTGSAGSNSATLSWSAVPNATVYNVYRTEGFAGCDFGKVLVGSTAGLSFTDTEVGNGRAYSYVVTAEGTNDACYTAASNCTIVTPQPCAGSVILDQQAYSCSDTVGITVVDSDLVGTGTLSVDVTSTTETTAEVVTLTENPPSSGTFTGSIPTTSNSPASDGQISIVHGDTITVAYDDASFCGPPETVIATATADCVAVMGFVSSTTIDACSVGGPGDNDGVIDPGETVTIEVTAENTSITDATGVSATLSSTTPGITILDATSTFPTIPAGGQATSDAPHFTVRLDEAFGCGTPIDFDIDFTSNEGSSSDSFSLESGSPPLITLVNEDFTGGIPGTWTVVDGGSGGGVAATWTTANPGGRTIDPPFSSPFAIVDSDEAGTSALQDEQLITPAFDASTCSSVTLTFDNQFRWFSGGLDEQCDVDVSTDGGSTWTNVFNMQDGSDGHPNPPNSKTVDLTATAAGNANVSVRFHYWQGDFDWWWAIDNVNIECVSTPECNNCISPCPTITLSPSTLPDGAAGTAYSQTITASGGTGPYTFAVTSGSLPTGLTLDSSSGEISGTPTGGGSFNFTVTATDANGCDGSQAYTVNIVCPTITLAPSTLPDGSVGAGYSQIITASGGSGPYTFAVTSGALPAGLTLDANTGEISGTPTTEETANFTITATDSNGCTGSQAYTVNITTAPACLFCDDFEDGILDTNWTYIKKTIFWSESGGNLIGTNNRKATAIASPVFSGCTNCSVEATMQTAGGFANRVWLLHHYIDKANLIEVLMKEEQNRWIIKQRVGKKVVAKSKVVSDILPNTAYTVRVVYTGTEYQLFVDDVQVATLVPVGTVTGGTVGLRIKGTTGTFGYIEVN